MINPRIYVDFHNADSQGRLRLNCVGTMQDLAQQQIGLQNGLMLTLYTHGSLKICSVFKTATVAMDF